MVEDVQRIYEHLMTLSKTFSY